jgi:hypothetical protein
MRSGCGLRPRHATTIASSTAATAPSEVSLKTKYVKRSPKPVASRLASTASSRAKARAGSSLRSVISTAVLRRGGSQPSPAAR